MGWRRYGSLHELKATLVTETTEALVVQNFGVRRPSRLRRRIRYRTSSSPATRRPRTYRGGICISVVIGTNVALL
jgi:hypothetical protein